MTILSTAGKLAFKKEDADTDVVGPGPLLLTCIIKTLSTSDSMRQVFHISRLDVQVPNSIVIAVTLTRHRH